MAVYTVNANGNYPDDDGVRMDHPKSLMIADPNGATVKLQYNPETDDTPTASKWRDVPDGSFTAVTVKNVSFNSSVRVRVNVASYSTEFLVEL